MAFKLVILIAVSSMWFIFGSIFFYRSTWGPEKFMKHTGTLEEIGTTQVQVKTVKTVIFFRLKGNGQVFGVQQTRDITQEKMLSQVKLGDTMTVFYTNYLLKANKPINLYVTHLESKSGVKFMDYEDTNKQYFRIGIILYLIDLAFSVLTIWYYRKYAKKSSLTFRETFHTPYDTILPYR
jgi:hypothetical protein